MIDMVEGISFLAVGEGIVLVNGVVLVISAVVYLIRLTLN